MQTTEIIKAGLDYIEKNLKTDITAEELGKMAGYSTYHYYRLFASVTGVSVAGYILKRRLDHALAEIAGGRKSIDVVLEYGFSTYPGFYKAFVKVYGCSPKKYLSIYKMHNTRKVEVASMQNYSRNELKKILENWDITKNLTIGDIYINGESVDNTAWMVGDNYILKTGNRVQRLKHIKVAKALVKQGFSAALPVKTKTGSDYLDGDELFILSKTVKGKPISIDERYGSKLKDYALESGIGIAKLHQALQEIQKDVMPDEVNLYETVIDWAMPNIKKQNQQWGMEIDAAFFEDYKEMFGKLYKNLSKQLIHRNPCPSCILYINGKVTGFEDFDLSECNVRLFDPCYAATAVLSETKDEGWYPKWLDILSGILQGYDAVNPLSAEERKSIFYVICAIQMICVAYFESEDGLKELAKINRKMLLFIISNKEL